MFNMMSRLILSVVVTLTIPATAATWVKSAGGANCEEACRNRDGCDESAWPKSESDFRPIASSTGQTCETTQAGGANYDPSTDGHHCGWEGPEDGSRCGARGDSSTYRFC